MAKNEKTFMKVLAETRLELAKGYLKDPNTRLEEIAFMLGYSEYSTFSRFVKKHTLYSPISYREKLMVWTKELTSCFSVYEAKIILQGSSNDALYML